MRINKYVALATGLSRRAADELIAGGRITVNGLPAIAGLAIATSDVVSLDGKAISAAVDSQTIILHKPVGYVVSRAGQGSKTVYELLPSKYRSLKPVGRLDKDSSGLLLLTNDGQLANRLTHPRYAKAKVYEIELDKPLSPRHLQQISAQGVQLDDGLSRLQLEKLNSPRHWRVSMREGRNRQIRRSFAALGYVVQRLHRTSFGAYHLSGLSAGSWRIINKNEIIYKDE